MGLNLRNALPALALVALAGCAEEVQKECRVLCRAVMCDGTPFTKYTCEGVPKERRAGSMKRAFAAFDKLPEDQRAQCKKSIDLCLGQQRKGPRRVFNGD